MNGESQGRSLRDTLERIYRDHRQGLFTLALAITRHPARAEDAVHDGLVKLLRHGRPPTGDPVAYVFAAVRNAALDARAAGPGLRMVADHGTLNRSLFENSPAAGPEARAVQAEELERLREAVDALPDGDREVVVLRAFAGLTFERIAATLDQPLQTVASRYRRALEKIRVTMAPHVQDSPVHD